MLFEPHFDINFTVSNRVNKIVIRQIDKWNPYNLLPEAPHDEFNFESESIARKLTYDSTVAFIAKTVSEVFSKAFQPQYFGIDDCMNVAIKIKETLDKDRNID